MEFRETVIRQNLLEIDGTLSSSANVNALANYSPSNPLRYCQSPIILANRLMEGVGGRIRQFAEDGTLSIAGSKEAALPV